MRSYSFDSMMLNFKPVEDRSKRDNKDLITYIELQLWTMIHILLTEFLFYLSAHLLFFIFNIYFLLCFSYSIYILKSSSEVELSFLNMNADSRENTKFQIFLMRKKLFLIVVLVFGFLNAIFIIYYNFNKLALFGRNLEDFFLKIEIIIIVLKTFVSLLIYRNINLI